jgi:hypothetical protein
MGAAEQQPHPAPWDWESFPSPPPTAKELNWRLVFFPPHFGHSITSVLFMLRTSFSNFFLQDSQTYS